MTKLPKTLEAAEAAQLESRALASARQHISRLKSDMFLQIPLPEGELPPDSSFSWLNREDDRRWFKHLLKTVAMDPNHTSYICNLAREDGWGLADEALRELFVEREQRGQDLPMAVRQYCVEIVQTAGRPRRGGWDKSFLRNIAICSVIDGVCEEFSLQPTRSRTSWREGLSGCRIVAKALAAEGLAMSEAAVVTIWTRCQRLIRPEDGWSYQRQNQG